MHWSVPTSIVQCCVLCLLFVVQGCGFFADSSPDQEPSHMELTVLFQDVHRCSFMSPEIHIVNAPKETTVYEVEVAEKVGGESVLLGKGSWHEDGTGIIPEGALTGHYRGPCPPGGSVRHYVFTVSAKKNDSQKPLAVSQFVLDLE